MVIFLSRVLPTSRVFIWGYVNTETILHFFNKVWNTELISCRSKATLINVHFVMCVAQLVNAKNWDENETVSLTQRLNFMEIDKQNILTLQV